MSYKKIRTTCLYCGGIARLATGCASPAQLNPELERARVEYTAIKTDPLVAAKAPVALKKAEEALTLSEQMWKQKADKEFLSHQIYLAQQLARIAHETAVLKVAEEVIEGTGLERKAVQLEAPDREAKKATMEADLAKGQTKIATMEAEAAKNQTKIAQQDAQAHIEKLTKQLNDLEAKQTERDLVLTLKDVLFGVGKTELKPGTQHVADQLAAFLVEYPERKLLIEGHTDNQGSEASNQDLSLRRAEAVRQALVSNGAALARVRVRGYGETYPVTTNNTAEGRQQNRRVEVVFSDDQGKIIDR
ncbi:MAG: DUF4398 domain-containing protein [Candidatus Latescibacteria bacterium]|nr:DUF4398 domain-containing protein [Candidatus Latescibacterota bacterium]